MCQLNKSHSLVIQNTRLLILVRNFALFSYCIASLISTAFLNHLGELKSAQRNNLRRVSQESNALWIILREHFKCVVHTCAAGCILCNNISLFTATSVSLLLRDTYLSILKCNYSRAKSLSNGRTLSEKR